MRRKGGCFGGFRRKKQALNFRADNLCEAQTRKYLSEAGSCRKEPRACPWGSISFPFNSYGRASRQNIDKQRGILNLDRKRLVALPRRCLGDFFDRGADNNRQRHGI